MAGHAWTTSTYSAVLYKRFGYSQTLVLLGSYSLWASSDGCILFHFPCLTPKLLRTSPEAWKWEVTPLEFGVLSTVVR